MCIDGVMSHVKVYTTNSTNSINNTLIWIISRVLDFRKIIHILFVLQWTLHMWHILSHMCWILYHGSANDVMSIIKSCTTKSLLLWSETYYVFGKWCYHELYNTLVIDPTKWTRMHVLPVTLLYILYKWLTNVLSIMHWQCDELKICTTNS